MDNAKLFVGNLSWGVRDETLREAFEQAGTVVSASVMLERDTGRSRGFAFVEMASPEEAQAAIEMWNEKELDGRALAVNIAKPKAPRSEGFGGGSRGGYGGGRQSGGYRPY
ncbi:RNA-binding protein [Candidatus Peribacteria bacterium]|nr:RNA-binding protein [Candidatus Peribacteria bacterium]